MSSFYKQDQEDKRNSINRCFFDAEHGWVSLALDRLAQLHEEFPDDPQVHYAEALIRKDFLGQGLSAEQEFLIAQEKATNRSRTNENYLFSTFNAAKYARNITEYRRQAAIARELAPDDADIGLFNQIDGALHQGARYGEILFGAVAEYQRYQKHGDCAALAEIALQADKYNVEDELSLRRARMASLRELDKAAEASRQVRGEDFPPEERLTLQDAMKELELALQLDGEDHILWNFKSAWDFTLDRPEDSIAAADKALSVCPAGYFKPMTNKALSLIKLRKIEEARKILNEVLDQTADEEECGKQDRSLAKNMIKGLELPVAEDKEMLSALSERYTNAAGLTSKHELTQGKRGSDGEELLRGLKRRVTMAGSVWSASYVRIIAEMLVFFSAETTWVAVLKLSQQHPKEYDHCLHAALYLACHSTGVYRRDACRFLICIILGARDPDKIREVYREAIIGVSEEGPGEFKNLDRYMREELHRVNPVLVKLVAEQSPLSEDERQKAREVTLSRFQQGVPCSSEIQRRQNGCAHLVLLVVGLTWLAWWIFSHYKR